MRKSGECLKITDRGEIDSKSYRGKKERDSGFFLLTLKLMKRLCVRPTPRHVTFQPEGPEEMFPSW